MKSKYRTDTRDSIPPAPKPKAEEKPGQIGKGKLGTYDARGRLRGQVGPKATAATVSRFIGEHGAKLGTKNGRPAWLSPTLAQASAQGTATPGSTGDTLADESSKGAAAAKVKTGG